MTGNLKLEKRNGYSFLKFREEKENFENKFSECEKRKRILKNNSPNVRRDAADDYDANDTDANDINDNDVTMMLMFMLLMIHDHEPQPQAI